MKTKEFLFSCYHICLIQQNANVKLSFRSDLTKQQNIANDRRYTVSYTLSIIFTTLSSVVLYGTFCHEPPARKFQIFENVKGLTDN